VEKSQLLGRIHIVGRGEIMKKALKFQNSKAFFIENGRGEMI
jgi:hypothetical protein